MGDSKSEALQRMLDAPLSTSRGGEGEKSESGRPGGGEGFRGSETRKRSAQEGAEGETMSPNRAAKRTQHNGRRDNSSGGPPRQRGSPGQRYPQQQQQQQGQGQGQAQRGGRDRRSGGGYERRRQDAPQRRSRDDETHFKYRWTLTADEVQILSVLAFGTELITVSSNGNLRLDAGGSRSFRHYQAMNMCLAPLSLKLLKSEQPAEGDERPRVDWKLKHLKHGWTQDFDDGMKLSAFPNRDWKRILPKLKNLPQSVVFSYETEKF
mmetsp:Transcript_20301/g.63786  ORF Transcript_20301/g.63786 Transcript_20301/m.63786 type:complete len:265 (+) Transcript_20301:56-850(+)